MLTGSKVIVAMCCTAMVFLAVVSCAAGDLARAEQAQVQYDKGFMLEKQGDHDGAIAQWQDLLSKFPLAGSSGTDAGQLAVVRSEALLSIGERQRQRGRLDDSETAYKKVIEECPQCRSGCAEATLCLGKIYQKKNENLKAIQQYLGVLTRYPERISRANIARSRVDEIRRMATDLQIPYSIWNEMSEAYGVYDIKRQEDERITNTRRAAIAKGKKDQAKEAKADLEGLFADPAVLGSASRLLELGCAQVAVGDKDGASKTFAKYYELAEKEYAPEALRLARVNISFKLGGFEKAAAEATEALKIYPEGVLAPQFIWFQSQAAEAMK